LRSGEFALHLRRMRRLYRQRRDALVEALERHLGRHAVVEGASAGMHLALCLADDGIADVEIARRARGQGIVVNALSAHALPGAGGAPANGLLLGYAQVPVERMDALVARLADTILDVGCRTDRMRVAS
jgi:GntR family transcriptional regulator/MocR family aminotransferase